MQMVKTTTKVRRGGWEHSTDRQQKPTEKPALPVPFAPRVLQMHPCRAGPVISFLGSLAAQWAQSCSAPTVGAPPGAVSSHSFCALKGKVGAAASQGLFSSPAGFLFPALHSCRPGRGNATPISMAAVLFGLCHPSAIAGTVLQNDCTGHNAGHA